MQAMEPVDLKLGVTAPQGFFAAGITCGLKASGTPDLALVVGAEGTCASGAFTTNQVTAAPVVWTRDHIADGDVRAVVLNSGNANAATGPQGMAAVERTAHAVATAIACRIEQVAVCSTGVIGVPLDVERVCAGVEQAAEALTADGGHAAAEAICTTDTVVKQAGVVLPEGVIVAGMAKGAAMLAPALQLAGEPAHATMLVVVTTDAVADATVLRGVLGPAVGETFNRIIVDGEQSTNDSVVLLASQASNVRLEPARLGAAVRAVCESLARQLLADAEGATKLLEVEVTGAQSTAAAHAVARRIAGAPLLKAAIHGGDPNWGRVLQAAGDAGVAFDLTQVCVALGPVGADVVVFRDGAPVACDLARLRSTMSTDTIRVHVDLGAGGPRVRALGVDLSAEYVRLNSEYTT